MIRKALLTLLVGAIALGPAAAQGLKVGVVDMRAVIESYYKTKNARVDLNERQTEIQRDLELRRAKLRDLAKQLEDIKKLATDESVTPEFQRVKTEEYRQKFQEAKALEKDIEIVGAQKRGQLKAELERVFRGIRDEVTGIVNEKSRENAFDLVFDKSGIGIGGSPLLLYSKDAIDFTSTVLDELNKDAPEDFKKELEEAKAEAEAAAAEDGAEADAGE